ncbi:MAG: hypothetical protein Q9191_000982 [Dirinaria sp. TL-2023a]
MDLIEDFDQIFNGEADVAYPDDESKRIRHHRRSLEGELFVDRLLRALGIQDPIVKSHSPDHHKQSLLYYLLRDLRQVLETRRAEDYAQSSLLPNTYKTLVDGLWFFDRLKFERALSFLTEPSLTPTFPQDILYTLCKHSTENDTSLPLAYYHSVPVSITSGETLEAFFDVLCHSSISEAYQFSRAKGEIIHSKLLRRLVKFVFAQSQGAERESRSVELITLPFTEVEETWLEKYLGEEEGKNFQGAADTLTMRSLATGRFNHIHNESELHRDRSINGLNWAKLTSIVEQTSNQNGIAFQMQT